MKQLQIALQPAFAVTGHFAQGRTMAHVTTGAVGGCSGYVTLSRAKTRQGLALTSPVTLDSILKSPLPDCLQRELKRHEIMEENTLKKHGFKPGVQEAVTPPNDVGSFRVIMDGEVVTTIEAKHSGQT